MIRFACASCAAPLQVPERLAGGNTRCPRCQSVQAVPAHSLAPTMASAAGVVSPAESVTLPPSLNLEKLATLPPAALSDQATVAPTAAPLWEGATQPWCGSPVESALSTATIPGYELLAELGRGGMGVVYQARHLKLNRLVALKMILAGSHAGAADLARFQTEAEAIARLQHANIVQVYEVGEHEGKPFFSLEFCGGGSLEKKLNGTPLPASEAAALVETLARAMQAAHAHHIIHRDLKPANVLLTEEGTPKITDFGLAKKLDEAGQTQSGAIMGTPSYMAPEQAGGKTAAISPSADVYALGAILYECLTGRPPFKAATAVDTILQVMRDEPAPPTQLQTKTPRDLETICLKCLQKEPSKRYASASALAEDLARFREDRPILARPVSRLERGWRWCHRNPVVAILSAVGSAGVVMAVLLLNRERTQTLKNLARAEGAERDLTGQLDLTATAERELTGQLWKSYRDQAEARRFSHQAGQRFESLKALTEAARIARSLNLDEDIRQDLRRKAIACLALPDLRLEKELPGWTSDLHNDYNIAIDETFERYALRDNQGAISVRRVADGQEIVHLPGTHAGAALWVLTFSPNGRYLAASYNPGSTLKVWDLDRKEPVVTDLMADEGVDFSPDGHRVVIGHRDGEIVIYDLATGRVEQRWKGPAGGCTGVTFHPDGRQFATFNRQHNAVHFWAADSGQLLGQLPQAGTIDRINWNHDGQLLAVTVTQSPLIYLWNVSARTQVGLLEGHKNLGIHAVFHPATDLLVSRGWESMLRLWEPKTGKQLLTLPGYVWRKFSRNGEHILLLGKTAQIWEVADGREYRTFVSETARRPGKNEPYDLSVSPDGSMVAVGMKDGTRLWDLASGKELAILPTDWAYKALFQPSGDLLTGSYSGGGLHRWPIRPDPERREEGGRVLRVGPPEPLLTGRIARVAQSKDGRTVAAIVNEQGVVILNPDQPGSAKALLPHLQAQFVSVSADGQWVATGTHSGNGIKVWSVRDHKLECQLPIQGGAIPVFSPGGSWLYTNSAIERRLWKIGSWEPGPPLPHRTTRFTEDERAAFTPDGRWLALTENSATTIIVDTETGRTVATLDDPNQDRPYGVEFSPDGSQLVFTTWDSYSVHVWDLRRIRAQLKAIDLDWDAPPYPMPRAAADPLAVRIVHSDLLDPIKRVEYQRGQTVFDLYVNPFDGEAHLRHATFLLAAGRLEAGHAHLLAALAFRPDLPKSRPQGVRIAWRLSGEAYVRQARWQDAAGAFVQLAELEPKNALTAMQAAALLLASEDREGYRRLCEQILERFPETTDPYEADKAAKACLIGGECQEADLGPLAKMAEVAVVKGQKSSALGYFQFCRGLSEYRHGRDASALEWFARSRKTYAVPPSELDILNSLFEAMALYQSGRTEEAGRSLARATALIDKRFAVASRDLRGNWHDWLFCQVARKEAETVLKGKPKPGRN